MKKIIGFLTQRWLVSLLGILAIALIIWFVGPLIQIAGYDPLVGEMARLVLILVVVLLWGLGNLRRQMKANRANEQMMDGIVEAESPPAPDQGEEEVAELRERFEQSMELLKKTRGKHDKVNYLYELPWYIIIGPPGSGKTTAIRNSDLKFPLAERFGKEALQGRGGTRNCDWWFTDEAILLDTAGRYVTQDSHQDVDRTAWLGFLDLLKRHRKRRPINGVFVAISVSDLLQLNRHEREAHVRAIRERINELYEHFGIRFPVYVLITKCDLVAGFTEFFDDLGREERAQVWGFTFPLSEEEADVDVDLAGAFTSEYDALLERINERLLARMGQERDVARRGLIFDFPRQMLALRDMLGEFLVETLRPTTFDIPPLWRGVYFTSGTQEGEPIDRIVGSMARSFGVAQRVLGRFAGEGRSYFITNMLQRVAFAEAGLAGANRRAERRLVWLQSASYVGVLLVSFLVLVAWFVSYSNNKAYIERVAAYERALDEGIEELGPPGGDVAEVLPVLNAAREIPGGYGSRDDGTPWSVGFGLYQGNKLGRAATGLYRRLLDNFFLPRLMNRVEDQLRWSKTGDDTEFLYEGLKSYLMIGDPEHFEAPVIAAWMQVDWETTLPADGSYGELTAHLDALLEDVPSPLPVAEDAELVAEARRALLRRPHEERVYARLKKTRLARDLEEFSIERAAGSKADAVFRRASGEPLSAGIPGLYTYDGYHDAFLPESERIAETIADESWIMGEEGEISGMELSGALSGESSERAQLEEDVVDLYLRDYANEYERLLNDLALKPIRGLDDAAEALRILSDEKTSPLKKLLAGVERQIALDRTGEENAGEDEGEDSGALNELKQTIRDLAGRTSAGAALLELSWRQERIRQRMGRFQKLSEAFQDQGGRSPFDDLLALMDDLYTTLDEVASSPDPKSEAQERSREISTKAGRIDDEAEQVLPPGPATLVGDFGDVLKRIIDQNTYALLNDKWRGEPLKICRQAIEGRYPLKRTTQAEIRRDDFLEFFGPGGDLDRFFEEELRPYVDTTRDAWRWLPGSDMQRASVETLEQFKRAKIIRDTFFRTGGLLVRFELTPISMDPSITRLKMDIEGQSVTYSHGPPQPQKLKWPGDGPSEVRIQMSPPGAGMSGLTVSGDWAWFRVLDQSNVTPAEEPEHFIVTFRVGGREARYELSAASAFNPFRFNALESFRCPDRL